MEQQNGKSLGAHAFVFLTGAAVMATEMCASRFIAPWFGTSMIVWAVIIAAVMAAMSLGYWLGGRLADRRPSWAILYSIPVATGVLIALIPLAGRFFFSHLTAGILSTPVETIVLTFVGVVAVFVPPVFLLAMVSPLVIRLLATEDRLGRTAGSLYAVSTLGSIAGTLVPAFGTIPFLGTRETMLLCSGTLIVLGGMGLRGKGRLSLLLLLLPAAMQVLLPSAVKPGSRLLHEEESLYQFLQVQRRGGGTVCLIVNEGGGMQSIARPGDELRPYSTYYESYLLLPYMSSAVDTASVLVIGAAAGTIPHWMAVYLRPAFGRLDIDAVEIDPAAVRLGHEWFGTRPGDSREIIADGRIFAERTTGTYDAIITDVYSNQIYIPFHLATLEYFTALRNRLRPGGVVAMNVNALDEDSEILQSIGRTLGAVFGHVYVAYLGGSYNFMLVASDRPLRVPGPESLAVWNPPLVETAECLSGALRDFIPSGGMILTDNRAPVEFMTDAMIAQEAGATR